MKKYGCSLHACVLMTNHIHLLVMPQELNSINRTIHHVGRHYVTYANHSYDMNGTLWERRHKGCAVSSEEYLLLACMRYIELNPVRRGWYKHLANIAGWAMHGIRRAWLVVAVIPSGLPRSVATEEKRGFAYREFFQGGIGVFAP